MIIFIDYNELKNEYDLNKVRVELMTQLCKYLNSKYGI